MLRAISRLLGLAFAAIIRSPSCSEQCALQKYSTRLDSTQLNSTHLVLHNCIAVLSLVEKLLSRVSLSLQVLDVVLLVLLPDSGLLHADALPKHFVVELSGFFQQILFLGESLGCGFPQALVHCLELFDFISSYSLSEIFKEGECHGILNLGIEINF